jgi:hypothetical protein
LLQSQHIFSEKKNFCYLYCLHEDGWISAAKWLQVILVTEDRNQLAPFLKRLNLNTLIVEVQFIVDKGKGLMSNAYGLRCSTKKTDLINPSNPAIDVQNIEELAAELRCA